MPGTGNENTHDNPLLTVGKHSESLLNDRSVRVATCPGRRQEPVSEFRTSPGNCSSRKASNAPAARTSRSGWVSPSPRSTITSAHGEDLVRSILQTVIDEGESFVGEQEARHYQPAKPSRTARRILRLPSSASHDLLLAVSELTTLADIGLVDKVLAWPETVVRVGVRPADPRLSNPPGGVIAFAASRTCCLQFPDTPGRRCGTRPSPVRSPRWACPTPERTRSPHRSAGTLRERSSQDEVLSRGALIPG